MTVDTETLAVTLAERLGTDRPSLVPLGVKCAWPVFRAEIAGHSPIFVKVTERAAAERALAFLGALAGDCPFLPRPVLLEAPALGELAVLCLEWKEARRVNAEDMTEGQLGSFLDGCVRLSRALAAFTGPVAPLGEDAPDRQHAQLAAYAARHPFAGRLLRPLLGIPATERTYGARPLVTIHGDLQPENYGFDGERFAAVFDTDDITQGLACEDATYAFTERARRGSLSSAKRRRLAELFRRFVAISPWPRDEWLIAISHARLRIAARRLARHPDAAFVALDIRLRDRPLRAFARLIAEGWRKTPWEAQP